MFHFEKFHFEEVKIFLLNLIISFHREFEVVQSNQIDVGKSTDVQTACSMT